MGLEGLELCPRGKLGACLLTPSPLTFPVNNYSMKCEHRGPSLNCVCVNSHLTLSQCMIFSENCAHGGLIFKCVWEPQDGGGDTK